MKKEDLFILRDIDCFEPATESMRKKQYRFENRVIDCKVITSNHYLSQQLQIPFDTKLFYLARLRIVEGFPVSMEKTYIAYEKVEGIERYDFKDVSFYGVLNDKYGIQIYETKEDLLIVEAKNEEKEYLQLKDGDEILFERGQSFLEEDESPFEYFEMSSLPSFYRFRSVIWR